AARNLRWLRPFAWFCALIMFLNGLGHTLFTIVGHTLPSVTFPRPAPGFYSSPLLLIGFHVVDDTPAEDKQNPRFPRNHVAPDPLVRQICTGSSAGEVIVAVVAYPGWAPGRSLRFAGQP